MNEAIILAGGLGTRLQNVIKDIPKPMAPVSGKPFLEYLLNYIYNEGISRVILSVGYRHETISSFFGNNFRSMALEYVIEDTPLGTGGGIAFALQKAKDQHIFILNGDTFFPISLKQLAETHIRTQAEISLALKKTNDASRYGRVFLDGKGIVTSFEEKGQTGAGLINGGIYLLNRQTFAKRPFSKKFSFEKDYLEKIVSENGIAGCIFDNYFLDIGIPETLARAQDELKKFA